MKQTRCAIYTRKSSEEGLDQAFNSLAAQREACEAYIRSQKHEGWRALPEPYDDGGLSGGTLERPALQRLLADIDAGRVDLIVVYKVDRLTRSLADFAKLVERLDARQVSFVSVTQQFNTSTSMGRLTLNVLLSFAQFEREVTGERIRDKIAASKAKGMWMGGLLPLGYDRSPDGLAINQAEAETVRLIFSLYLQLGSVREVLSELNCRRIVSKARTSREGRTSGGVPFERGALYHLLSNPVYVGRIRHRDKVHDGHHQPILDQATFDAAQVKLESQRVARKRRAGAQATSPLAGKLFDETGDRLVPSHAARKGVRYRYYVSHRLLGRELSSSSGWRLPAAELESRVVEAMQADAAWRRLDQTSDSSVTGVLDAVVRIDLSPNSLRIAWRPKASGPGGADDAEDIITEVKFSQRRRGVEQRLVFDEPAPRGPDRALVKLFQRAHAWADQLRAGMSITDIAIAEDLPPPFVTQRIHTGLLSPKIAAAIIEGRVPGHITAQRLVDMATPLDWRRQEQMVLGRP